MNSSDLVKELLKDGWEIVKIRGSHHYFKHSSKKGKVTIPHPKKDLPVKTWKSIRKQAQLD
jgi:predicted RNA binding protein YcfA (HicA-like mRNA interferase family)